MIDLEEIEREINKLEARGETTYSMCERLSWLYVVRDHLAPPEGREPVTVRASGSSEFLRIVDGADYSRVLDVLDEHMEALQAVYPKEYNAVIAKLRMV